ncbi:caspase family protein [bacterium]|nr:caspase family protein [bacterium]
MTTFTQGHALLVGVGGDLPNTVDDAKGIAELLLDPERCAYPPSQVTLLTGQDATRARVIDGLTQLAQRTGPNDTVIVYFSGHGYRLASSIGTLYFLMTYDYNVNKLGETAISGSEFVEKLRALQSRKLLLLLDCCHAGGLKDTTVPIGQLTKSPMPPEAAPLLAAGQGRIAIASSRADELSYAGKPYSAFTLALAEALCGVGASTADGYVRVMDLALHAGASVPRITGDKQHPSVNDFQNADNFLVAYYAGGQTMAKGLPFNAQKVEIEPEPGVFNAVINQTGQTVHGPQTNIGGAVHGSVYSGSIGQIGDRQIDTAGGAYIGGNLTTGGDFVGRDRVAHHTQITTGDISGSGIAIGPNARAEVRHGLSADDLDRLFLPLHTLIQSAPASQRHEAGQKVEALKTELAQGNKADDEKVATLVEDIAQLAPDAIQSLVGLFAPEALGRLAGGVTRFVLKKLQRQ